MLEGLEDAMTKEELIKGLNEDLAAEW